MKARINRVTIQITREPILSLAVDAIVNATDTNLGLPAALETKAGAALLAEIKLLGWCEVGSATITGAGGLPFKKIIHAVGPRWGEGSERGKLANATWRALQLAEDHELRSIAIPPISTGTMGYPVENCATTMLTQIIDFTFEPLRHLRLINICVTTEPEWLAFQNEFALEIEKLRETGEGKVYV